MSYIPPPYNQLTFSFGASGYTPPTHNQLLFGFGVPPGYISPPSIDDSAYGTPNVEFYTRTLTVPGFSASSYGTPLVYDPYIRPSGFSSAAYGSATVYNKNQLVLAPGVAPPPQTGPNSDREVPSPIIGLAIRYLLPAGVLPGIVPTTHAITRYTQYADLSGRGIDATVVGSATTVTFAVRYIEPPFIASNIFGSHNVARIQVIAPSGWASSTVSVDAAVDINLQRLFAHSGSADPATYGVAAVRNAFENVFPSGWASAAVNFPVVYNLDQYALVLPFMGSNDDPTQWPTYAPYVENKNRTLRPSGWQSSRFSVIGNVIENAARQLSPQGFEATLWGPATFIAYRDRTVSPASWDSFYSSSYAVVYNGARIVAPVGWLSTDTGIPVSVLNLNRTVKQIFPYGGETVGTAFVAYAVRTIAPSVFKDPASGIPEVRHNPYQISPVGIAPRQVGGHVVEEHFNIIYPSSANVHSVPWVGEPIVENRNKTLRVFPSDQSLYGLARVTNYNTYAEIGGGDLLRMGAHQILFRNRSVNVAPIAAPTFSVVHQVRNVIPDPPGPQRVDVPGIVISDAGNPGIPIVRLATIYPLSITSGETFGTATVRTNAIRVDRGIFTLDQMGTPTFSATQYVYPTSMPFGVPPYPGDSDTFPSKPRLSPHTIYAPGSDMATAQAVANHGSTGMVMDSNVIKGVGNHVVSNYIRTIGPVPLHDVDHNLDPSSRFGSPAAELRNRYVYPAPIRSLRMGVVAILGTQQHVDLDAVHNGFSSSAFGAHTIAPPPVILPPTLYPVGLDSAQWGTARVELFNREIQPQGIPHRGNPQQGLTNPWGLPLVGFPRVYVFGGFVATEWGTTWVSHKNRELPVEGWNSSTLEDEDLGSFADRMRVSRRNPQGSLQGFDTSVIGDHTVTFALRSILSRGVDSFYPGFPVLTSTATIAPAGWDSLEVGDIDEWEAGKIKAHGDDMSAFGTPRMGRQLRPLAAYDGIVGEPRFGVPLYPVGIPQPGLFGPSVSNPFGCTNRVVTPLPILSQEVVPQPVITEKW